MRAELAKCADDKYREFVMRGVPSERPFLGVRVPQIREVTTRISANSLADFMMVEPVAFEEVLERGMLVARLPYPEMLKYFSSQVDYIDDWCTCDTFCSDLRPVVKAHREEFLEQKIESLLQDKREFAVRVGLVMLKCCYVDFDYLALIFDRVEGLTEREEYYIRMAIAWLVAECFIKFPEPTLAYLKMSHLPKWTFNKTISKICDSRRVESEVKEYLKALRK